MISGSWRGALRRAHQGILMHPRSAVAAHRRSAKNSAQRASGPTLHAPDKGIAGQGSPALTYPPARTGATSEAKWEEKVLIALIGASGALVVAWLTSAVDQARKEKLSAVAGSFTPRRVDAVKDVLKKRGSNQPLNEAGEPGSLLERSAAMSIVSPIGTTAGLYMVCGPKGEGKSSLMKLFAQQQPFVIYVDLQNGSVNKAVRAVAAAIGYSLEYSADELVAKAMGFEVPEIKDEQGFEEFGELLLVFEQACNELRKEGVLGRHMPVLILE
jgi:hypothetical protein